MSRFWTEDEEGYLEMFHYDEPGTLDELAETLGRSMYSVRIKASKMRKTNANIKHLSRPWSEQEISVLKSMYSLNTCKEISNAIDRTENAIKIKANKLGLKKHKNLSDLDSRIRKLANDGNYLQQAARKLGVGANSLYCYSQRHGIEFRKSTMEEQTETIRKINNMYYEKSVWNKRNK